MKKISFFMLLCILQTASNAQQVKHAVIKYHAVKVGDKVPPYVLNNLINYPKKTASLADFKNKWLILDFWGTHCMGCMAAWPHLLDIQKQFAGKIQIITLDPEESKPVIVAMIEKRKKIMDVNMNLPTQCGDLRIKELFPYSGVPHMVWIDNTGVMRYITYSGSVSPKNIEAVLNGKIPDMLSKINNDQMISPDASIPLFLNGNGGDPKRMIGQSVFAQGDDRLFPGSAIAANKSGEGGGSFDGKHFAFSNGCIRDFYSIAYSNRMSVPLPEQFTKPPYLEPLLPSRMSLEVKDSSKYVDNFNGEYRYDNHYVYQLISPDTTASIEKMQEMMQADLKRYIGLDAHWEKRKKHCLVLTAEDTLLIQYKGGAFANRIIPTGFTVNNISIAYIQWVFEDGFTAYDQIPIIDETGFKGKVGNMDFEANMTDYKAVDAGLQKYKMHLTMQEREIDVLVISEPANYKPSFTLH